ncbi:MAG TPA: hypothetical protein VF806_04165 [Anaerolineaceae bacterium]
MPSDTQPISLTLQLVADENADREALDRLTRELRSELLDLDVESVELARGGPAPDGSKAAEVVTLGALAVSIFPTLIPKLVDFLQSWSLRGESRTVKIKAQAQDRSIEVEYSPASMTPEELKRLVETITQALPPAAQA